MEHPGGVMSILPIFICTLFPELFTEFMFSFFRSDDSSVGIACTYAIALHMFCISFSYLHMIQYHLFFNIIVFAMNCDTLFSGRVGIYVLQYFRTLSYIDRFMLS